MQQSQLNEVITFTAVAAGATVVSPHNINVNGIAVLPDFVYRDNGDFAVVSCTPTMLTVRNDGIAVATLNAWLLRQHTFDRAYGAAQITNLSPQPYIPAATGAGGSGGAIAFRYTVTGLEPDLSDFIVTMPVAQLTDTYKVVATLAGATFIFGIDCPDTVAGDRTLTTFRFVSTGIMAAGDKIDFVVAE